MEKEENNEDFRRKYKGKSKERYNKAIRAESPGGNELLDLLQLVSSMRGRAKDRETAECLRVIEDRLQAIRNAMVEEIREYYQIPAHREEEEA